jgi:hypothetical protein
MQTRVQKKRWLQLFRSVLQLPPDRILFALNQAEAAIVERARELHGSGVIWLDEREDLDDALYLLHAFRTSRGIRPAVRNRIAGAA